MGLFSSPKNKYSQERKPFPSGDFKKLFVDTNVKSLSKDEEDLVYQQLEVIRSRDGKLSMRDVYNVLHGLVNKNKISPNDKKILIGKFENYFNK